ncbi:MAG: DnaA/Hda family protein [Myxococcota bacterium]|nr:DnaA/Hda family protein [Myxococcota bacterium]
MTLPPEVWDGVLRRLARELPPFATESWLAKLIPQHRDGQLYLLAPNAFHKNRVRDTLLPGIRALLREELGREIAVQVEVGGSDEARREMERHVLEVCSPQPIHEARSVPAERVESRAQVAVGAARPQPTPASNPTTLKLVDPKPPTQGSSDQCFANFVVGPTNSLAREASLAIATQRHAQLQKLYLYSPAGLGKTHLARAIALESSQRERVRYATAERFTNDFMTAVRAKTIPAMMRRYRKQLEVLVIEDVQFLSGKSGTQLELFHTVQELVDGGARVVFTGDRPAAELDLEPQLRDQICSSFLAPIESPDAQLRRQLLREKAAAGGIGLPEECLDAMVQHLTGSVRELDAALVQLVTTASLLRRPIDRQLVHEVLETKGAIPPSGARRATPALVIEVVARFFDTTPAALATRSRRRDVLVPRQLAMVLCRRFTDVSLVEIGRAFGREHSAVRNAIRAVERRVTERAPARYQLEAVSGRVRETLEGCVDEPR